MINYYFTISKNYPPLRWLESGC